jgi:hypothetical protein
MSTWVAGSFIKELFKHADNDPVTGVFWLPPGTDTDYLAETNHQLKLCALPSIGKTTFTKVWDRENNSGMYKVSSLQVS